MVDEIGLLSASFFPLSAMERRTQHLAVLLSEELIKPLFSIVNATEYTQS
jgi:hypothetical protein